METVDIVTCPLTKENTTPVVSDTEEANDGGSTTAAAAADETTADAVETEPEPPSGTCGLD